MGRSRARINDDIRRVEARIRELQRNRKEALDRRDFELTKLNSMLRTVLGFRELGINGVFIEKVNKSEYETRANIKRINKRADLVVEDCDERIRNNRRDLDWYYVEYRNAED